MSHLVEHHSDGCHSSHFFSGECYSTECHSAEYYFDRCHSAECRSPECHSADSHYNVCYSARVIMLGAIDDSYSAACHSAKCHLIYHSTEFPSATFILLRDIRTNIPPNVILHNVTPLYAVLLNVVAPSK